MTSETSATTESVEVKTCSVCGGTWPAGRPHCPACGASLTNIAARPPADAPGTGPEEFDWRWLDAMAPEGDEHPQARDEDKDTRDRGSWWKFWR